MNSPSEILPRPRAVRTACNQAEWGNLLKVNNGCTFNFIRRASASRIDGATDPVANVIPRVIDVKMWYFFCKRRFSLAARLSPSEAHHEYEKDVDYCRRY